MKYDLLIGQQSYSNWSLRAWLAFAPFDIPVTLHFAEIYGKTFHHDVAKFGGSRRTPLRHENSIEPSVRKFVLLSKGERIISDLIHSRRPRFGAFQFNDKPVAC